MRGARVPEPLATPFVESLFLCLRLVRSVNDCRQFIKVRLSANAHTLRLFMTGFLAFGLVSCSLFVLARADASVFAGAFVSFGIRVGICLTF